MSILDRLTQRFLQPLVERQAEDRASELLNGFVRQLDEAAYDPGFDFEFSAPYRQADRLGGPASAAFREWTVEERRQVIWRAQMAWRSNPLAKGIVRLIRGFVVSHGLSITYRNNEVEEIIEEFRARNRRTIQRRERQWFEQLVVDGEVFVRIFTNNQLAELSQVSMISVKPWLVDAIETEEGNRDSVVAYWIRPESGNGTLGQPIQERGASDRVMAEDVVHCAVSLFSYEQRGRSELFVILPWLNVYKDWLENRARINRYKGFLYHLQVAGATPAQVSTKRSAFRQPPAPSSVYVSSDKETLHEFGGTQDAGRVAEDGRALKLMSLVAMTLPEYMLAEGENANLATATAQQMPALRSFEAYQDIYTKELWRPIYEAVLTAAGLDLDAEVPEHDDEGKATGKKIKVWEAFEVVAPALMDDDPKDLAEALTLAQQAGWMSTATAATRFGVDWAVEKEKIELEDKEEVNDVVQGKRLGNLPVPAGNGPGAAGDEDDEEDDDGDQGQASPRDNAASRRVGRGRG